MNEKMTLEELKKIQENKEKFYKKLAEDNEFYVAEIKKKDLEITALKMEHEHDVKMIDEVKGETVKLYKELKKRDKLVNEVIGYIATRSWITCPNEECGANLDCENRCSNDDSIYEECWKMYFGRRIEQ